MIYIAYIYICIIYIALLEEGLTKIRHRCSQGNYNINLNQCVFSTS